LVGELATHGSRHAQTIPEQPLRLTASLQGQILPLELHDNGTDGTVARRTPEQHDGALGFGLELVARLSRGWGVERDGHGTTVWLELAAADTDA
jgi:hypothetical protein